jgi:hypothetical protein
MTSQGVTDILAVIILIAIMVAILSCLCTHQPGEQVTLKKVDPQWMEIGYYRLTEPESLSRQEREILASTTVTDLFPTLYEAINTNGNPFWCYELGNQWVYPPRAYVERRAVIPKVSGHIPIQTALHDD